MKIKFVYYILPALVIYTDRIKAGFAGIAYGPLVLIRPAKKGDAGLLQHELTHTRQAYRDWLIFAAILYKWDWHYRLLAEVEAYRVQLQYSADYAADLARYAHFIATKYDLPVTVDLALRLLTANSKRQ